MKIKFVIPIAPVPKKNSSRILLRANGKPFVAPSEQYERYARSAGWFIRPVPPKPIDFPVTVKCLFYLPDERRRDLTNLLECIDDILVENRVLADDNYKIVASHDGSRCFVNREQPRTEIYIEEYEE